MINQTNDTRVLSFSPSHRLPHFPEIVNAPCSPVLSFSFPRKLKPLQTANQPFYRSLEITMQVKRGRGRGVLGLREWQTPLRRPKALLVETSSVFCDIDSIKSPEIKYSGSWAECVADNSNDFAPGQTLMMKYSYTANADSPLGEPEISVRQKEEVIFVEYNKENPLWSKVKKGNVQGYVPSNYIMAYEAEVTSLPWLKSEILPQQKAEYKPYKSAYAKEDKSAASPAEAESFHCDVCCKDFNGPQPYNMHMKSKAHKEEVEAQAEY
ncbi:hypothetical protein FSP39_007936 [Pinctada imbricata]|uniref:C2H2-type domain-containing protein n=1 Tax=Pinctada imbricata TaxID=66713 RepID=A0AA88XYI2_PINIB|nr:hypothetical protein FSP39_007936 [Pinctada imbricata]